jgi:hypothetical protein
MKNKTRLILYVLIFISPLTSYGQGAFTICNSFDTTTTYLSVDTLGIWEIGQPNKSVFDSSYSGVNSIVTDLDSLYPSNDTSKFYAVFKDEWGGVPNYLGLYSPLEIEFNPRFITDSISDYGSIEMSLDNGNTWYDILSSEHNATWGPNWPFANEHYFEGTGDTLFDSLAVFGNSNGWVHSKFSKDIEQIIWNDNIYPDSIIVKFSFISDSIEGNEGWQIDNLCMSMDFISGIAENQNIEELSIYPNPNNGEFSIPENSDEGELSIYNLLGKQVYSETITKSSMSTNLPHGIYVVVIKRADTIYTARMVIK